MTLQFCQIKSNYITLHYNYGNCHTSSVHEIEERMEGGGGHFRRSADLIKVDDITDTPVTAVEYLITQP